ncbi:MAG: DNA gyrase subunit A [Chloroflexi bacterium]|nr:DNA gyrase subunit A [Chloroflexota bacterium]
MEIGNVRSINIEDEMRGAYLDYAMSVITARALPDVRDGLKPVQRRILFAMDELSLHHTSPYKKSARIVGEVLGKYHPHGDAPVYETMVRMAQNFSMRYVLVDGQGNFGSVDGDPPAAMRYTEARLAAIAEEMLADIDKNTVNFTPNFDGSLKEPTVLPAKLPNLLLNGSSGIAVGMATNIPPHNLNEIVDAIVYMIGHFGKALEGGVPFDLLWSRVFSTPIEPAALLSGLQAVKPELRDRIKVEVTKLGKKVTDEVRGQALLNLLDEMIDIRPDNLMEFIKGPDFPTAGIILGEEGIKNAYTTGHGRIAIRAKAHVEDMRGGRHQIIITQLPFQVNKATLQEKIAELVRDRRVEGISELRDESDRQGMRVVIELKREAQPKQVLNQLFKYTAMQSSFSINMLALVDGQPRVLTLKMVLLHYINYRKDVITRRTQFDLDRARHRAHIFEGLKIALDNLDEVIATIRRSRDADTAKVALMKSFKLSDIQAQAILDMQLRRLAALERKKIIDELAETLRLISYLEDLLAHPEKILNLIRDELAELKNKYGDARRTKIVTEEVTEFTEEDLIPDEPVLIAVSNKNYVKRMPADTYRAQRRAKSITGTISREDDPPQLFAAASTLDQMMFFSNRGRAFQVKANDLPDVGRQARGSPLSNFITLQPDEKLVGGFGVRNFDQAGFVVFLTARGDVKRVALTEYSSARSNGVIALSLADGDECIWAGQTDGNCQVIAITAMGQAIRFAEADVRASGRTSGGMRAIKVGAGDRVVDADVLRGEPYLVVVTKLGHGKRTLLDEFPVQGRGGSGVRAANVTDKVGAIVGAKAVGDQDDVLVTTTLGAVFRSPVDAIPEKGRALQVARLFELEKGDSVNSLLRIHGKGEARPTPSDGPDASPPATKGPSPAAKDPIVKKPTAVGKKPAKGQAAAKEKKTKPAPEPARSQWVPVENLTQAAEASPTTRTRPSSSSKPVKSASNPKTLSGSIVDSMTKAGTKRSKDQGTVKGSGAGASTQEKNPSQPLAGKAGASKSKQASLPLFGEESRSRKPRPKTKS